MRDPDTPGTRTEGSIQFAPRQSYSDDHEALSSNDNNSGDVYSPSKIFQRHRSLAELSNIAVSEKQALDRENSNASEASLETFSQGFEAREGKDQVQNQEGGILNVQLQAGDEKQVVQMTPTKATQLEEFNNSDPLTPTANLKMLMSVVSPAIRDRDEKKKDLFMYTDRVDNVAEEVVIERPPAYSRKDKSLGLLCQRFLAKFPENPGEHPIEICLDEVSKDLKVERRRVYDIVNVLESVDVLSRVAKNRYLWHGKTRIAQTLGKLKDLSRAREVTPSQKITGKENIGKLNKSTNKMKRYFSSGDMPRKRTLSTTQPLKEMNLTKEDERKRIKAAIESTDHGRKDKSLGVLSQKFLLMFLLSKSGVVTLEDAANVLLDEQDEGNVKYKTKVRRLYDIANILSSLMLIEKVHIRGPSGKKPGFKWIGIDINSLPENMIPTSQVLTFKTKHSLLPETMIPINNHVQIPPPTSGLPLLLPSCTLAGNKNTMDRWSKSASCGALLARRASSTGTCSMGGKKSVNGGEHTDGFLVHEFASSPVNVLEKGVPLSSPTDITFREEIQRLQQKFPNRMSQLLAVLPFSPSHVANGNKTSRRKLFNQTRPMQSNEGEPIAKKPCVTSGDSSISKRGGDNETCNIASSGEDEGADNTNKGSDAEKGDNQTKFIHSTNSPFKVMSSSTINTAPMNTAPHQAFSAMQDNAVVQEKQLVQEQYQNSQKTTTQFNGMVGMIMPKDCTAGPTGPRISQSGPRMVQLVDQAVSPIPACKFPPGRASIAVQTSLIKDISPLKPLMFVHHRIPSPWKLPASSPSSAPPAPPSTPELHNELSVAPFQSQANTLYLHPMSPFLGSQSCGTSPVAFSGAQLFFPPSPSDTSPTLGNQLVLSQGNLLYNVSKVMRPSSTNNHSNSCPSSINPSPTLPESGRPFTPANSGTQPSVGGAPIVQPTVNESPMLVDSVRPFTSGVAASSTQTTLVGVPLVHIPLQTQSNTTPSAPVACLGAKPQCVMVENAQRLGATPCLNMDNETQKDGVSRKLYLTNQQS